MVLFEGKVIVTWDLFKTMDYHCFKGVFTWSNSAFASTLYITHSRAQNLFNFNSTLIALLKMSMNFISCRNVQLIEVTSKVKFGQNRVESFSCLE